MHDFIDTLGKYFSWFGNSLSQPDGFVLLFDGTTESLGFFILAFELIIYFIGRIISIFLVFRVENTTLLNGLLIFILDSVVYFVLSVVFSLILLDLSAALGVIYFMILNIYFGIVSCANLEDNKGFGFILVPSIYKYCKEIDSFKETVNRLESLRSKQLKMN